MLAEQNLIALDQSFRRIFSFKINRTSFREVQNAVYACAQQDKEEANQLLQTLFTGKIEKGDLDDATYEHLSALVKEFSVPIRLSQEVANRGEFVSMITADTIRQGDAYVFLNRIRRIDGDEFQFLTDMDGWMQLLLHVSGRLGELSQSEDGKKQLSNYKQQMEHAASCLSELSQQS